MQQSESRSLSTRLRSCSCSHPRFHASPRPSPPLRTTPCPRRCSPGLVPHTDAAHISDANSSSARSSRTQQDYRKRQLAQPSVQTTFWIWWFWLISSSAEGETRRCKKKKTRSRQQYGTMWDLVVSLFGLLLFAARPISAVRVAFDNCLPEEYVENKSPVLLQWVPLYVDAFFDTATDDHTLRITMYGNVTGSRTSDPLPAWDDTSYWNNDNETAGKIEREPRQTSPRPRLTTLHSKVDVLTYEPWNNFSDFCQDALAKNFSCPLAPVFNTSVIPFYDLPSAGFSQNFHSSYAFTSFAATFIITYGDDGNTTIGCVSATVTPDLGHLAWMLKFLPVLILLTVGFATIFASIYSPWGSTDIFHWSSNYGRDPDLLRLVTPGFGDCLGYIQFICLTGGLALSYPGFYPPIVSQASWSALMFNSSFVSKHAGYQGVRDGIYVTDGKYGLQDLGQLVGLGQSEDIWAGMMVWLLVIIAAVAILCQTGFGAQRIYRAIQKIPEEDLRNKNFPFSIGNVVRIVLNYFLLPVVTLSTFQLVVAPMSPAYTVALAALTLAVIIGFAGWLLYLIVSTKPRAVLFDDLPTVLLYGPLYNTYSDEVAAFALTPVLLTFVRGIVIGAIQPIGIAQVVILAICEVLQIIAIFAFRPYHSQSSMNAYHALFSAVRLVVVLLMIAFIPALGVTEGPKGWIAYVILLIHGAVLVLGFFLNAIQTILEVAARMAGAGSFDVTGQTRGGLSKIFGMRQLSKRVPRRGAAPSRQSQLSSAAILDPEEATKFGFVMPSGRVRSSSAGSMGVFLNNRGQRSSSALGSIDVGYVPGRPFDSSGGAFTPTTPGEMSDLSFLPSGTPGRRPPSALTMETADPYYRPPRRSRRPTVDRDTMSTPAGQTRGSWASGDWSQARFSQLNTVDLPEAEGPIIERGQTPAPHAQPQTEISPSPPRADYSTREVDFYYGVRGRRLNSDAPNRKLGTGPADPTGPMASAAGWLRSLVGGGKSKDKGKGFEVVRSSRMPPAMQARGGDFGEEPPPEGIPVAMGVLRNGPIESDDEDDRARKNKPTRMSNEDANTRDVELLDIDGNPQQHDALDDSEVSPVSDSPPLLPGIDLGESIRLPSRLHSTVSRAPKQGSDVALVDENDDDDDNEDLPPVPDVPRKSSRRHSGTPSGTPSQNKNRLSSTIVPGGQRLAPSGRLPFERTNSHPRRSSGSSMGAATEETSTADLHDELSQHGGISVDRPTSVGYVHQGSISRVDPEHGADVDMLGSSAELVDVQR